MFQVGAQCWRRLHYSESQRKEDSHETVYAVSTVAQGCQTLNKTHLKNTKLHNIWQQNQNTTISKNMTTNDKTEHTQRQNRVISQTASSVKSLLTLRWGNLWVTVPNSVNVTCMWQTLFIHIWTLQCWQQSKACCYQPSPLLLVCVHELQVLKYTNVIGMAHEKQVITVYPIDCKNST